MFVLVAIKRKTNHPVTPRHHSIWFRVGLTHINNIQRHLYAASDLKHIRYINGYRQARFQPLLKLQKHLPNIQTRTLLSI